jgi:uncharacterized membrane protein
VSGRRRRADSQRKEGDVADLIAIGYDDEETAEEAAEEVYRLARDLVIEPEAVAVIKRDKDGKYKAITIRLRKYACRVRKTSLSKDAEQKLQEALAGAGTPAGAA